MTDDALEASGNRGPEPSHAIPDPKSGGALLGAGAFLSQRTMLDSSTDTHEHVYYDGRGCIREGNRWTPKDPYESGACMTTTCLQTGVTELWDSRVYTRGWAGDNPASTPEPYSGVYEGMGKGYLWLHACAVPGLGGECLMCIACGLGRTPQNLPSGAGGPRRARGCRRQTGAQVLLTRDVVRGFLAAYVSARLAVLSP
jgi:hypothetical protein